jgi:hypothetical protein
MSFVAGQKLRVSDLDGGTGGSSAGVGGGSVYLAADLAAINNTTSFVDTGLALTVVANAVYAFRAWIRYNSGSTPDMKMQPSTPSGTTGYWSFVGHARDAAPALDTSIGTTCVVEAIGTSKTVAGDATGTLLLAAVAEGYFITSSTAGTFKLRAAQRTATASDTIIRAGSYMTVTRLA